jgi:hypothetical protein
MTYASSWIAVAVALAAVHSGAHAADRAKVDVACQPGTRALQYECMIKLSNARTDAPLTKVDISVGADMPSMPMTHNVSPVKASLTDEAGTYRVRIELEMHGDWALQLNLSGEVRDRVIKTMRFEAAIKRVRHELQLSPAIAVPSKLGSESASRSGTRGIIRSPPRPC